MWPNTGHILSASPCSIAGMDKAGECTPSPVSTPFTFYQRMQGGSSRKFSRYGRQGIQKVTLIFPPLICNKPPRICRHEAESEEWWGKVMQRVDWDDRDSGRLTPASLPALLLLGPPPPRAKRCMCSL